MTNKETYKTTIAVMKKDINHINDNIDEIKSYIKEDRNWKENFAKCLDKKYAGRWVEVVAIGVLVGLLAQIFSSAM